MILIPFCGWQKKFIPGKSYDELKKMTLDFWLTSEDLPSPENRVMLTKNDQIKVHYHRNITQLTKD